MKIISDWLSSFIKLSNRIQKSNNTFIIHAEGVNIDCIQIKFIYIIVYIILTQKVKY